MFTARTGSHSKQIRGTIMLKSILSFAVAAGLAISAAAMPSAPAPMNSRRSRPAGGNVNLPIAAPIRPSASSTTSNQVVGFDVDIGNEIAKRLGVKGVNVSTAWDGIIAGLLAGKYDSIIGSMTITAEREKAVDFVGPYYRSGRGIFVAEGSAIKSLDDLKDKTIGVTLGETHEKWARERGGWEIRTYKGLPELFLELKAGRVDAIVVDSIPVAVAIKDNGEKIRKLEVDGIDDGNVNVGIAIRKNNPELKAAMQKALDDMMADGTYETIAMKWIGSDPR